MSKRAQERRTGEELVLTNSRPESLTSRSLSVKQPFTLDSGTSYSPEKYRLCWNSDLTRCERSVPESKISQVWHRGDNPFSSTESSVREMNERPSAVKPVRGVQNQLTEVKLDHQNLQVFENRYIEKVLMNVRRKLNRPEGDQMLDHRVHLLIWGLFMTTTMKAVIHVGEDYNKNLVACGNTNFDALKTFFDIRQKLILNQKHEKNDCFHD